MADPSHEINQSAGEVHKDEIPDNVGSDVYGTDIKTRSAHYCQCLSWNSIYKLQIEIFTTNYLPKGIQVQSWSKLGTHFHKTVALICFN